MNIIDAVLSNKEECIKMVIKEDADLNIKDMDTGFTALHYCAQNHDFLTAKTLMEAGAKVDEKDTYGNTPLFKAVFFSKGETDLIKLLLAFNANPDEKNNAGVSPRELASSITNFNVSNCFK
ncbi:MAG: ankyrin repeat domain-containing protein [Oscillospiraceae bacterium]|nr:ankyrin repeat domain-containing protein [Oscillospiraceae bacterium]